MPLPIQQLKVDQTALLHNNSYLLISNINIPSHFINQLANNGVLQMVINFIDNDYTNVQNIYYQVTATYTLRHSQSGATKQWTGSFSPAGNVLNAIQPFQLYTLESIRNLPLVCNVNATETILRTSNLETLWKFESLTSIILNVQALVPFNHPTLLNRDLVHTGYGRRRVHISFPLPGGNN